MRVVIGEDESLLRAGLTLVLEQVGFDVVGQAEDGDSLVELTAALRPDLVVTDIRMPPRQTDEGIRAAKQIREATPGTGVVVLSQFVQRRYAQELLAHGTGGIGYLLKRRVADVETFGRELHRVAAGETVLDPEVVALLVKRASYAVAGVARLTERQREVLSLMAQGYSNAAIAKRTFITERAVVRHVSHVYDALDLEVDDGEHRRVLAVLMWLAA